MRATERDSAWFVQRSRLLLETFARAAERRILAATISNSLFIRDLFYAPLVTAVYPYPARGTGRCRGREPQIPGARGLHPAISGRHLFVSFSGAALVQQDRGNRSRRDGPYRAGVLLAGAASARALGS